MITVFVLSYKRQQNLGRIVDSIRANKHVSEIVIFNNDPDIKVEFEGVTVINSSRNWGPWVKPIFPQLIQTEWVMVMDDDLMLQRDTVGWFLENAKGDEEGIYGFFGMSLNKNEGKPYSKGERVNTFNIGELTKVDILLGRVIFCKTSKLAAASYFRSKIPGYQDKKHLFVWNEDIVLSMANAKEGYSNYVVTSPKGMGCTNLPEGEHALSKKETHFENRDAAVREMLKK